MNSLFWPIRPEHRPWSASSRNSTIQNLRTYVGTGKLDEIRQYVEDHEIRIGDIRRRTVVKAGSQYREGAQGEDSRPNKPDSLDIFAKRAQTATARTQVELAQYRYLLPRLTRMWTHPRTAAGRYRYERSGRHRSRQTAASSLTRSHG